MRNCKWLHLLLRRCLSISVDTWWTAQAQAFVNCRRLTTIVYSGRRSTLHSRPWLKTDSIIWHTCVYHLSAVAHLITMLSCSNHFSGSLVKTSSITPTHQHCLDFTILLGLANEWRVSWRHVTDSQSQAVWQFVDNWCTQTQLPLSTSTDT